MQLGSNLSVLQLRPQSLISVVDAHVCTHSNAHVTPMDFTNIYEQYLIFIMLQSSKLRT